MLAVGIAVLAGILAATVLSDPSNPGKRGVASVLYLNVDPSELSRLGATWAYDWTPKPPPRTRGLAWVPMIWGLHSAPDAVISALTAARRDGQAKYLLGFNEPDNRGQAAMTPVQAAALWPKLEQTGLELGSPAPSEPDDGWLAQFMAIAAQRHLRVNFIALHFYPDFTNPNAVSQVRQQLIAVHTRYHLPIWITEVGAIDLRKQGHSMLHQPTEAGSLAFMQKLFPMLDTLPFVKRYAWFTDNCWNTSGCKTSSLFNRKGGLTALGRAFESTS